jgi:hypothetical protein
MIERRWSEIRVRDTVLVIVYGIFFPMILGCLAGLADYFLQTGLRFTLSHVLLWIVAVFTGIQVRKQFLRPHIVYTVLTGIGIFMAGVIMLAFPTLYATAMRTSDWAYLFDVGFYAGVAADMLNPLVWFEAIVSLDFTVIIRVLIFIVGIYLGINKTFR